MTRKSLRPDFPSLIRKRRANAMNSWTPVVYDFRSRTSVWCTIHASATSLCSKEASIHDQMRPAKHVNWTQHLILRSGNGLHCNLSVCVWLTIMMRVSVSFLLLFFLSHTGQSLCCVVVVIRLFSESCCCFTGNLFSWLLQLWMEVCTTSSLYITECNCLLLLSSLFCSFLSLFPHITSHPLTLTLFSASTDSFVLLSLCSHDLHSFFYSCTSCSLQVSWRMKNST